MCRGEVELMLAPALIAPSRMGGARHVSDLDSGAAEPELHLDPHNAQFIQETSELSISAVSEGRSDKTYLDILN